MFVCFGELFPFSITLLFVEFILLLCVQQPCLFVGVPILGVALECRLQAQAAAANISNQTDENNRQKSSNWNWNPIGTLYEALKLLALIHYNT